MKISDNPEKKREACLMLQKKAEQLGRVPCKSDFSPEDVVFIKARLGPWPNALVSAGLKEKKKPVHHEENRRRKSRQKRASGTEEKTKVNEIELQNENGSEKYDSGNDDL